MERRPDRNEREPDENVVSGMPDGEPELTPMGIDTDSDDADPAVGTKRPGFPVSGEPDVSS